LASTQFATDDGLLAERTGPLELRFRLHVVDGAIEYRQVAAALRWGPIVVRLPRFLEPRVAAFEEAIQADRTRIRVRCGLPLVGLLIGYDGFLEGESS
jgi:hypothetical protein